MKRMLIIITAGIMLIGCSAKTSVIKKTEKDYQKELCALAGGEMEVTLSDGTRCDCMNDEYVLEYDFAPKHYEALGQMIHYMRLTGKKGKIVLILRKKKEKKFLRRLIEDIKSQGLKIEVEAHYAR